MQLERKSYPKLYLKQCVLQMQSSTIYVIQDLSEIKIPIRSWGLSENVSPWDGSNARLGFVCSQWFHSMQCIPYVHLKPNPFEWYQLALNGVTVRLSEN